MKIKTIYNQSESDKRLIDTFDVYINNHLLMTYTIRYNSQRRKYEFLNLTCGQYVVGVDKSRLETVIKFEISKQLKSIKQK